MSDNNEMLNLINQARSEARTDILKRFFSRNGKVFTTAATAVVVGTIGFFIFSFYKGTQEVKYSAILHRSLLEQQVGDVAKAQESLKEIVDSSAPNGVKSLASLRYASLLLDENKKSQAAAIYQEVNDCSGCDAYIKDLAGLLAIKTWVSDENEIKKDDLLPRIEKIESNSKALKYEIAEQKGLLEMNKDNLGKSYQTFESLSKNPEAPQVVKVRAVDYMKRLIEKGFNPDAALGLKAQKTQEDSAENSEEIDEDKKEE